VKRLTVQLCKNILSDGSNTWDVIVAEEYDRPDDRESVTLSPATLREARYLIEVLHTLCGAVEIEDTERHS